MGIKPVAALAACDVRDVDSVPLAAIWSKTRLLCRHCLSPRSKLPQIVDANCFFQFRYMSGSFLESVLAKVLMLLLLHIILYGVKFVSGDDRA